MPATHKGVEIRINTNGAGSPYASFYVGEKYHGVFYFDYKTPHKVIVDFARECAELIAKHLPA